MRTPALRNSPVLTLSSKTPKRRTDAPDELLLEPSIGGRSNRIICQSSSCLIWVAWPTGSVTRAANSKLQATLAAHLKLTQNSDGVHCVTGVRALPSRQNTRGVTRTRTGVR